MLKKSLLSTLLFGLLESEVLTPSRAASRPSTQARRTRIKGQRNPAGAKMARLAAEGRLGLTHSA